MVSIIIMLLAAAGMIVGAQKHKAGVRWGKPLSAACIVLVLLCAFSRMFSGGGTASASRKLAEYQIRYQEICGEKLGKYLAGKYADKKVVIITQPKMPMDSDSEVEQIPDPLLEGLRTGFGDSVTIIDEVSPELPKGMGEPGMMGGMMATPEGGAGGEDAGMMMPPMDSWFTPKAFDKIARRYKGRCDLIVTMMGLPEAVGKMDFWELEKRPKVVVANGAVSMLKRYIKDGDVVAAISFNPGGSYDEHPPPEDLDEAFAKRYLLVTPENVDSIASQYGSLFRAAGSGGMGGMSGGMGEGDPGFTQ